MHKITGRSKTPFTETSGPRSDTPFKQQRSGTQSDAPSEHENPQEAHRPTKINKDAPKGCLKPSPKKHRVDPDGYGSDGYNNSDKLDEGPPPPLAELSPNIDDNHLKIQNANVQVSNDLALAITTHLRAKAGANETPGLNLEEKKDVAQTLFNLFEKLNRFKPTNNEMSQLIIKSAEEYHQKQDEALKLFKDSNDLARKIQETKNLLASFNTLSKWTQHLQHISGLKSDFKNLNENEFTVFKRLLSISDLNTKLSEVRAQITANLLQLTAYTTTTPQNQDSISDLMQKHNNLHRLHSLISDCLTLKSNPTNQDFLTFFSKLNHSNFRIFQELLKGNLILEKDKLSKKLEHLESEDVELAKKENKLGSSFDEFEAAPDKDTEFKTTVPKKTDWLREEPYCLINQFVQSEVNKLKTYDTKYAYKDPDFFNCINMDDATEYLNPLTVMSAMLLLLKKESQKPSADDTGAQSQLFDTEQIECMSTFFSQNIQKLERLSQENQTQKSESLFENLLSLFSKNIDFFDEVTKASMAQRIAYYCQNKNSKCYEQIKIFMNKNNDFIKKYLAKHSA